MQQPLFETEKYFRSRVYKRMAGFVSEGKMKKFQQDANSDGGEEQGGENFQIIPHSAAVDTEEYQQPHAGGSEEASQHGA